MDREIFGSTVLASWLTGADIRPKCGFRVTMTDDTKVLLAGMQEGNTERYERCWGMDTTGGWIGPAPFMEFPRNVRILGAATAQEGPAGGDLIGVDTVYHVPTGQAFQITWDLMSFPENFKPGEILPDNGQSCYWFIRDAGNGNIVKSGNSPTLPLTIDALDDGSYALFCCVKDITRPLLLPDGYDTNPLYYYYENDIEYYYDPVFNIGRFPSNPENPLWIQRLDLVEKNQTEDRNDWISYLISPWPQTGEWSGIRFVVGSGEWAADAGVQVAPGVALAWLDTDTPQGVSPSTPHPIHFDPMARQVTLPLRTRAGKYFIGGSRITASGVATALWEITPGATISGSSFTLRALDFSDPRPWSECWIEDHTVTGLVELENEDRDIIVSNLCQTYRYDPDEPALAKRLKPTPSYANGEPGGRCLVGFGEQWAILTEQAGMPQPSGDFENFYNCTLQYIDRTRDVSTGTVFHGESCAVRHLGKMYGVKQDAPFSNPFAQQYFAWHDRTWNKSTLPSFDADELQFQRLGSANGVLYVQGKEANSDQPVMAICDGNSIIVNNFGYRLRQICATEAADSVYDSLIACGRPASASGIEDTWVLVEFAAPTFAEDEPQNADEAKDILDDIPGGVSWRAGRLSGRNLTIQVIDGDNEFALWDWDQMLREAHGWKQGFTAWARVDSTADYDDLESYNIRVPYQRRLVLPGNGAYERVDVLFFVPNSMNGVQAPGVYVSP